MSNANMPQATAVYSDNHQASKLAAPPPATTRALPKAVKCRQRIVEKRATAAIAYGMEVTTGVRMTSDSETIKASGDLNIRSVPPIMLLTHRRGVDWDSRPGESPPTCDDPYGS